MRGASGSPLTHENSRTICVITDAKPRMIYTDPFAQGGVMRCFICSDVVVLSDFPRFNSFPLLLESKHPFTFEDMMTLKRIRSRSSLPMANGCCSARLT